MRKRDRIAKKNAKREAAHSKKVTRDFHAGYFMRVDRRTWQERIKEPMAAVWYQPIVFE